MSDIVQDILAALAQPTTWEPDHPQYIEGRLWLTSEQWQAVVDQSPPPQPGPNRAQAAWGIPVELIQPNEPVTLPSGKTLLYSTLTPAFYVFAPGYGRYRSWGADLR